MRFMIFGIHSLGARNATLADLGLELDPTSLAALLGYSAKVMTEHAARAPSSHIERIRNTADTPSRPSWCQCSQI